MSDLIFDIGRDLQRAYDEGYEQGKVDVEQTNVPNTNVGDLISRQAVIDIAKSSKSNWIDNSVLFKRVSELPSVEPERKFIEKVLETLREMDDAVDVICNLDVDAVLDRMDVE